MDEDRDEGLCCCEYVNRHGETSHILALCCDCQELDSACDSLFKGESVGDEQMSLLSEDILDRLRIPNPFGDGAKRIDEVMDLTVLPPIFFLPLGIYIASINPVLTLLVCFVFAPVSIYWYYRRVLKHRQRTQFFMSWALTSFLSMYALMALVVYPEDVISPIEFAAMTLLFSFFHLCFFYTRRGPDQVISDPTCNKSNHSDVTVQQSKKRNHVSDKSKRHEAGLCADSSENYSHIEGAFHDKNYDWCRYCQHSKPKRSGHCHICGLCFYRLDHHCVWLDCCIGRNNHFSFIICLVVFIVGCLWGSLRVIVILFGDDEEDLLPQCLEVYASRVRAILFVSALYVLGSGIAVISLLIHQLWLISHNWTFREKRMARLWKNDSTLRELNKGFFTNWKNFLSGDGD
ncbi:Palmitoyltransferase ZDHHC23 [Holothuria leucospilota]|uniref:Palmitoyltransferase n=1 Tax=Holothuria leucospilota TaxID=206669 RepID=A0A9Q1BWN7_HOLLE|nr:Palmitoyltransferase ZDHHC23 [Holothuria leucospilota]